MVETAQEKWQSRKLHCENKLHTGKNGTNEILGKDGTFTQKYFPIPAFKDSSFNQSLYVLKF